MNSEVPGLEGRQLPEGSATAQFAGAAKHWHDEAQRYKGEAQVGKLKWFVIGALSTAAGFFTVLLVVT